jgi:hypothetical protein
MSIWPLLSFASFYLGLILVYPVHGNVTRAEGQYGIEAFASHVHEMHGS